MFSMMSITVLAMFILTTAFIFNNITLLNSRLDDRITTQLDLMSKNLGAALLFNDSETAEEMLSTLSVDKAIVQASLYTKDEVRIALYDRVSGGKDLRGNAKLLLFFSRKVYMDSEHVGRLDFVVTSKELQEEGRKIFINSFFVIVASLMIVFFVALRIQHLVSGPIISLNQLSRKVAKTKDYGLRSDIDTRDEIGELSVEFNRMLEQVQERDSMLEKQVQQRTAELEKLAEEFRHRAFHDVLTGLPNRALLNEYFLSASAHANRSKTKMALLLLDLDNFKTINDTLGHIFGDELLKIVGSRIKDALRKDDLIVRLGGDEFVVLIENIEKDENVPDVVSCIAEKILSKVKGETFIDEQRIQVTASIGGAIYPEQGGDLVTLKRNADIAMYDAKGQGRNRFSAFQFEMESNAVQRLIVQNDLRVALTEEQLKLVYQPKVDARSGKVKGCEVLVRWQHPQQGFLAPDTFIPFAEENGMIRDVDYYMLERACRQAKQWMGQFEEPLAVAVNLSALHFSDFEIIDRLQTVLSSADLPTSLLEVEITEAMLINDPDMAMQILLEVRKLGIRISLDDFGVGYSSLNYLRTLPVDVVKLDRSFVTNILTNPHDERLTRGIVALTQGLELDMVAEGVETEEQAERLLEIGCYLMQGYHYLRPCAAEDFAAWLSARKT